MHIRVDDLRGPEIAALLRQHLDGMAAITPAESVHALDLDALRRPSITFWTVWNESALLGCGALKALDDDAGEIKSMRTASAHLRNGVAAALMRHIISEAERRQYRMLWLETGARAEFAPAHRLYEKFGFQRCGPFDGYVDDSNSVFMSRRLST